MTVAPWDQRRRAAEIRIVQAVGDEPRRPRKLKDVTEASGGDEPGSRAPPLKQRVGRDRGSVDDHIDVGEAYSGGFKTLDHRAVGRRAAGGHLHGAGLA